MPEKCPEYTSTNEARAIWRNKLSKFNTIGYFGRRPCSIAKGVFATKAIRNVTLTPDKAKISAYFNGENIDFDIIDLHRMGLSFSEKLDLKAWAKILYNQYDVKEITLIELMKSFVKYGKDTNLAKKLSVFIDYYEKDEKMVKGENTMSKLLYLKNKLDVIYDRKVEVVVKRKGLGEKNESRRIN